MYYSSRGMPRGEINWEVKYNRCDKQRAYAWAKFYDLTHREHDRDYNHHRWIKSIAALPELGDYVKKQLIEMGAELKKVWECPICLEFIEKDNLDITPCGHYYCKGCLERVKKEPFPKCAVCRHTFLKANQQIE